MKGSPSGVYTFTLLSIIYINQYKVNDPWQQISIKTNLPNSGSELSHYTTFISSSAYVHFYWYSHFLIQVLLSFLFNSIYKNMRGT